MLSTIPSATPGQYISVRMLPWNQGKNTDLGVIQDDGVGLILHPHLSPLQQALFLKYFHHFSTKQASISTCHNPVTFTTWFNATSDYFTRHELLPGQYHWCARWGDLQVGPNHLEMGLGVVKVSKGSLVQQERPSCKSSIKVSRLKIGLMRPQNHHVCLSVTISLLSFSTLVALLFYFTRSKLGSK